MKKRTRQTRTGNLGVTAIMRYCDENDLIFQAEPREDYGIDCYIELEADTHAQNFIIGIQSKAGPSYKHNVSNTGFSVYVSEDDIAYWLAANYPVFFVYYDVDCEQLYFKHVQDQLQGYTDVSECKKFVFSDADNASGGRLASYSRKLLRMTPNLLSRLEITKAKYPVLKIGENQFCIAPSCEHGSLADIEALVSELLGYPPRSFPHHTTVIGHSADGRWIFTLDYEDLGAIGAANVTATFLDTIDWAALTLPLFDHLQWYRTTKEPGMEHCLGELRDRANRIQEIIQKLGIIKARTIYRDPVSYSKSNAERPAFALAFGAERFDIELTRYHGRDALVLTNHAYSPARSISILSERLTPVGLIDSQNSGSLDIYTLEEVRRFDFIYEVAVSDDGQWVTFGILTNSSHDCWGCSKAHPIHVRAEELGELCVRALAV